MANPSGAFSFTSSAATMYQQSVQMDVSMARRVITGGGMVEVFVDDLAKTIISTTMPIQQR